MRDKLKSSQLKYLCVNNKHCKLKTANFSIYVLITNKLKSSQLKYLLIRYLKNLKALIYSSSDSSEEENHSNYH